MRSAVASGFSPSTCKEVGTAGGGHASRSCTDTPLCPHGIFKFASSLLLKVSPVTFRRGKRSLINPCMTADNMIRLLSL